jgi:malate dehydrogenase
VTSNSEAKRASRDDGSWPGLPDGRPGTAASAASAAIDHVRTWMQGTAAGDWTSMAIPSDGSYGIEEGLIYSFPVTCNHGAYQIVQRLSIDEFSRKRMDLSAAELREERDGVRELL